MNQDIFKLFNKDIEPFEVTAAPISTIYRTRINKEFRDVEQFADLVDVLDTAQEGDIVHIRLSTIGGALHAIIPLMASMKNTQAFIHMHVESDTASAGTLLMMLAHSLYVNEYSTIMFHNVSYGAYGHGGNVEAQVKHATAANKKVIRDMYTDFLTDDEIKRLEDGLELYLTPEECMDRFQLREEIRGAQGCECGQCEDDDIGNLISSVDAGLKPVEAQPSPAGALYKMPDEIPPLTGIDSAWDEPKPAKKPRKKK